MKQVSVKYSNLQTYNLQLTNLQTQLSPNKHNPFSCVHQMREQFDSGEKTKFTSEDNPHDVAALFKEYFRDLPEPLLTRELYSAFLESQSKYNQGQLQNWARLFES